MTAVVALMFFIRFYNVYYNNSNTRYTKLISLQYLTILNYMNYNIPLTVHKY